ncbi:MAG: sensor histidine kinase [Winogradskyella sp.]|nr:sensor histidine kinase [Winogradskyella sp.]
MRLKLSIVLFLYSVIITAQNGFPEESLISSLKSELNTVTIEDKKSLQDSLGMLLLKASDYYKAQKNYLDAIRVTHEAAEIFEFTSNEVSLSNSYSKLGALYYRVSNYENSQLYYFKSLKIEEERGNDLGIAVNLEKIGEIYLLTRDLDKATSNFLQAIDIYKALGNEKGIIFNLTNLGASYQKSGKIEDALKLYKDGLARAEKIDLKRSQSILLGNIGSSNRSIGNYQESLDYLFRALDLKMELKRYGSAAHSCSDIAETYMKLGDLANAKIYAEKAVKLAKNENLNEEKFAYYLLSQINYKLGAYENAYVNYNEFNRLRDSLFAIQKISRMNEMQIRYETEKREMMITAQQRDIELLNEKARVKNQYIVISALSAFLIFGLVLSVRSRNRAKEQKEMQDDFSRKLLIGQEEERNRIAKDLHDSVGQQLTLIKRTAQNENHSELVELTSNTLDEVRSISQGLYPSILKQLGLTASIEQLILQYDEQTDIFFTSNIDDIDQYFDESASLNFYRFLQEALSNIVKHSKATEVTIHIKAEKSAISFKLSDNGVGFDTEREKNKNSLGLKTLAERIKILKSQLQINSKANKGTSITVQIPVLT